MDSEYPDNKLTGATFEVYKDSNATGNLDDGDELLGTLTEKEIGEYSMNDLFYGRYFVKETKAPEGFVLDTGVYEVMIDTNGKTYKVENKAGVGFVNDAMRGNLKIIKTSSDGKVKGFAFRITGANGYDIILETNALRSEEYGLLQSRSQMVRYGRENKESEMQGAYTTEFGFRADTEKYVFVLRCNPTRGDYNFYCLCYVKEWLDKHIEEANRDIRFIDSHYKELFRIPDGERIIVTDRDGKTESYPCRYIDSYHTEVGRNLFHICEFAERMEQGGCTYAPMEPPLPPMCYSILPSTGEVIQIDRWQKGYTATSFNDGNRAENEAIKDKFNEKLGVSKAQEQAMLAGSMIRWDSIAAKPKSYVDVTDALKKKEITAFDDYMTTKLET